MNIVIAALMPLIAALPPFAQDTREIRAILDSQELYEHIPFSDCFEEISKTDAGYLITTNKRHVLVIVHTVESAERICGPRQFTLEFQDL